MPLLRESPFRQPMGDDPVPLRSGVSVENSPGVSIELRRRGVQAENEVTSPRIFRDDLTALRAGDRATLVESVVTLEGVISRERDLINIDGLIREVLAAEAFVEPTVTPPEPEVTPEPPAVESSPVADVVPTPEVEPDDPIAAPTGSLSSEELPAEGCETVFDVRWDEELQDYVPVALHWNGGSFELLT